MLFLWFSWYLCKGVSISIVYAIKMKTTKRHVTAIRQTRQISSSINIHPRKMSDRYLVNTSLKEAATLCGDAGKLFGSVMTKVLVGIPVLRELFDFAKAVYDIAEEAKCNQNKCKQAAERCRGVETIVRICAYEYSKLRKDQPFLKQHIDAIERLSNEVHKLLQLIQTYSNQSKLKRVLGGVSFHKEYDKININLTNALEILQADLGVHNTMQNRKILECLEEFRVKDLIGTLEALQDKTDDSEVKREDMELRLLEAFSKQDRVLQLQGAKMDFLETLIKKHKSVSSRPVLEMLDTLQTQLISQNTSLAKDVKRISRVLKKKDDREKNRDHIERIAETFEIDAEDIDFDDFRDCVGKGGQGEVYRVKYSRSVCAAKVVNLRGLVERKRRKIYDGVRKELATMCRVDRCENIVRMFGMVHNMPEKLVLVMEYASQGSLRRYLSEDTEPLPKVTVWNLMYDIVNGMKYIYNKGVEHRDLKSDNVLLDTHHGELIAKICDFGIAKCAALVTHMASSKSKASWGTTAWKAPEEFDEKPFSEKCDVYSCGVVFWEIMTRKVPFHGLPLTNIMIKVAKGRRPPLDRELCMELYGKECVAAMEKAWSQEADDRPSFSELLKMLPTTEEKTVVMDKSIKKKLSDLELEAQKRADEVKHLKEEKARLDEEYQRKYDDEKRKYDDEKRKYEEDQKKSNDEKKRIEEEWKKKLEEERQRMREEMAEEKQKMREEMERLQGGKTEDVKEAEAWIEDQLKRPMTIDDAMIEACKSGKMDAVRILLKRGADIRAKDHEYRRTPLHWACMKGHTDCAKLLTESGADVDARDDDDRTPLHLHMRFEDEQNFPDECYEYGNLECIKLLIEKGADVDASDTFGLLPLGCVVRSFCACCFERTDKCRDCLDVIKLLIRNGADVNRKMFVEDIDYEICSKISPLRIACEYGQGCDDNMDDITQVVKVLIENGADVNARDVLLASSPIEVYDDDQYHFVHTSTSLLMVVCSNSNYDLAKLLMDYGANVNAKDANNYTPLHYAARYPCDPKSVHLLVKNGADVNAANRNKRTPLHFLCVETRNNEVELLLQKGANVNAKDCKGRTPLNNLIDYGDRWPHIASTIKVLVENGAEAKEEYGKTALHQVYSRNIGFEVWPAITDVLIENGADVNSKDDDGKTPLQAISSNAYIYQRGETIQETVKKLIENGADVNAKDNDNRTPLLAVTVSYKRDFLSKTLIANGADVHVKDKKGRTPLHNDCRKTIVELLIDKGIDVNGKDNMGKTPLHYDVASWKLLLLLEHGADINAKDNMGKTPLHYISTTEKIKLLIKNGADVYAKDDHGNTCLHTSYYKSYDCFKLLIEYGLDAKAKNKEGQTPLHLLLLSQCFDVYTIFKILKLLIENGADVNAKDKYNKTPLVVALENLKKAEVVEWLIEEGWANIHATTNIDETMLHLASKYRRYKIVDILINNGLKVNATTKMNRTPLHMASTMDIAKLLVAKGADVHAKDKEGKTALTLAVQNGRTDCALFLIEVGGIEKWKPTHFAPEQGNVLESAAETCSHVACNIGDSELLLEWITHCVDINSIEGTGRSLLHRACQHGHAECAKILVQNGAKVNTDGKGKNRRRLPTPLYYACENRHIDIVKLLLENGANADAEAYSLHVACKYGHTDIVELLLENGANVDAEAQYHEIPLHVACESGHTDIVKLLLKSGANVHAKSIYGRRPLHVACQNGHIGITKLLLENGVNVHAKDDYGERPLRIAVDRGHIEILKLLIKHCADVNAVYDCTTPLHDACKNGHTDIVKLLLKSGANVHAKDKDGETPLHISYRKGHTDVSKLLLKNGADVNVKDKNGNTPMHSGTAHK